VSPILGLLGTVIVTALAIGGRSSTCCDPKQDSFAECGGIESTDSPMPVIGGNGCYQCICKPQPSDLSIPDMIIIDYDSSEAQ
jgi:hypothetical protein